MAPSGPNATSTRTTPYGGTNAKSCLSLFVVLENTGRALALTDVTVSKYPAIEFVGPLVDVQRVLDNLLYTPNFHYNRLVRKAVLVAGRLVIPEEDDLDYLNVTVNDLGPHIIPLLKLTVQVIRVGTTTTLRSSPSSSRSASPL
jgi:hypothetical protein